MPSLEDVITNIPDAKASKKRNKQRRKIRDTETTTPTRQAAAVRRPRKIRVNLGEGVTLAYRTDHILGKGTFGDVYLAHFEETGKQVAIKRVTKEPDHNSRELNILSRLHHPNIVDLKYSYTETYDEATCLNLVMEYVPMTLSSIIEMYHERSKSVPDFYIKLYAYQCLRSLAYLAGMRVTHRDIKPPNFLVDPKTHEVRLCDFGCSKMLTEGTASTTYIVSRYYRAPELICGNSEYTTAIDVWAMGCVIAEMQIGVPLFYGKDALAVLSAITAYIGPPKHSEAIALNPTLESVRFPAVKRNIPAKLRPGEANMQLLDLLSKLLCYDPSKRLLAIEALAHPYFDELRDPKTELPSKSLHLFNFYKSELGTRKDLYEKLVPEHCRERNRRA